jgi:hypothetical protein
LRIAGVVLIKSLASISTSIRDVLLFADVFCVVCDVRADPEGDGKVVEELGGKAGV